MAPIFLYQSQGRKAFDEAGTLITKHVLPTYHPGPYTQNHLPNHLKPPDALTYVPPLGYFCIKLLFQNVDSIDMSGIVRLRYHPRWHEALLRGLIPFFNPDARDTDVKYIDPRIWGTLIQLYSLLPPCFDTYTLPLSDMHLTQLQSILSTADFTLITVLDLASRPEITDDTIGELKPLTNLCVLDLSGTRIGSWGVRKLSMCLVGSGSERRGPWNLRVWSLRGCINVDESVTDSLARFPLLSAIDLRDTSVTQAFSFPCFNSNPPASHDAFYHPNPPLTWINGLSVSFPGCRIFESNLETPPHVLHINKVEYSIQKPWSPMASSGGVKSTNSVGEHDRVLAFFPKGKQTLHTTHDLSIELDQAGALRDRLHKNLRREERQNGDGLSYGEYGEFDSVWSDTDRSGDSSGEGNQEEEDWGEGNSGEENSEEGLEVDDLEEGFSEEKPCVAGRGPFNLHEMAGVWAHDWDDSEDSLTAREWLHENLYRQNHVAALVARRDTAEREAQRFYEEETCLRIRGGASRASASRVSNMPWYTMPEQLRGPHGPPSHPVHATATRQILTPPIRHMPTDDRARRLMFFRTPPPFNSIPDACRTGAGTKRHQTHGVMLSKKRKIAGDRSGLSGALLDRLAMKAQDSLERTSAAARVEERMRDDRSSQSQGALGRARRDPQNTGTDIGRDSAAMSLNPFLVKTKLPSQRQIPSVSATLGLLTPKQLFRGGALSDSSTFTPQSRPRLALCSQEQKPKPVTLPAKLTVVTNKALGATQQRKRSSKPKLQKTASTSSLTEKAQEQKGGQAFDMKAWAIKTKR